jgi:putative DNA-invertase from lambdoid prophage Rac
LAVFAEFERDILRDRVKAGIDQARKDGKPHGRPKTAGKLVPEMKKLRKDGISKRAIAKQLGVSRTSVIRLLRPRKRPAP